MPTSAEQWVLLGNTHASHEQWDQAIAAYRQAIALRPDWAQIHHNLGNVLHSGGRLDQAIAAYQRSLELGPGNAETFCALGNLWTEKDRMDEAVAAYRRALQLQSDHQQACIRLGEALQALGQVDQAIELYRQLVALRPEDALGHLNLGLALLSHGDLREGWPQYQWRWRLPNAPPRPVFSQPQWHGEELAGRRILLYIEQGYGDAIQFVRYAPMVQRRGGAVILGCQPGLLRLFQRVDGLNETFVTSGQPLPAFDLHCPLLDLPWIFNTDLQSIPATVPYLSADPALAGRWAGRLQTERRLKVGLAWAGRPAPIADRSVPLARLAPLADAAVRFFSLQKEASAAEEARQGPPGLALTDWTGELSDFAETAALIQQLDLVITIDTAVAHLAGAMGKATWVLLRRFADWRWLLDRSDCPWYPTMRLFRQRTVGDWDGPVGQIAQALRDFTSRRG